jgi:hypothetical protein
MKVSHPSDATVMAKVCSSISKMLMAQMQLHLLA